MKNGNDSITGSFGEQIFEPDHGWHPLSLNFQDYSTGVVACQFAQFQKNILCKLHSLGSFTLNQTKKKKSGEKFVIA
jgi:hypothetical protein